MVEQYDTEYSYQKKITWNGIKTSNTGTYECRASTIKDDTFSQTKTLYIEVHGKDFFFTFTFSESLDYHSYYNFVEPRRPEIESTNLVDDEMKLSLGEPFRMFCDITGLPDPVINWYKNGVLIENDTRISPSPDMKTLDIKYLKIEDDGEFKCVGENRLGTVEKSANLKITSNAFDKHTETKHDKKKLLNFPSPDLPKISVAWFIGIAVLILVLVLATIYLSIRFRRERRVRWILSSEFLSDCESILPICSFDVN